MQTYTNTNSILSIVYIYIYIDVCVRVCTILSLYTSLRTKGLSVAAQCGLFVANLSFGAAYQAKRNVCEFVFEVELEFEMDFD